MKTLFLVALITICLVLCSCSKPDLHSATASSTTNADTIEYPAGDDHTPGNQTAEQ